MKTSELKDIALDWAVAKCEGYEVEGCTILVEWLPNYGTDWSEGGPIIERECINLFRRDPKTEEDNRFWLAHIDGTYCRYGVSALVAAMRCFVASRLGDEVEIPEELTK